MKNKELSNKEICLDEELSDLPQFLINAINKMEKAWQHLEKGDNYTLWDCDFCELQSEINIAEVEKIITSQRAWELREKYLKIKR